MRNLYLLLITVIMFGYSGQGLAQTNKRIAELEQKLQVLSTEVPGLNQKVQLAVTGVTLQQYLNALARTTNVSISLDPQVNFTIFDSLNGVSALNVLTFLAQKYNLDMTVIGDIIYITPYHDPLKYAKPLPKELNIKYDKLNDALSLDLANDSLISVARKITQLSGKNIIVPGALQAKTVTGLMQAAPFETALEKLAFANQLKMTKTADNFFLFQALGENEELYVNGDNRTSVHNTFKPVSAQNRTAMNVFVKTIKGQRLLSADVVDAPIADVIKQASQDLSINYTIYSEIKGAITLHVTDVTYDDLMGLLFKGTDFTFRNEGGVYLFGDSKFEGLRTNKVVQLQNRSLDTIMAMIPSTWKKEVEIREFREQNALVLTGPNQRTLQMESFIKQLDVLVPVVLLEITMIDISKSRKVSTGISAGVSDSVKTGGTLLSGMDFTFGASSINSFLTSLSGTTSVNLGRVVPNFYVSLHALEANNNVNVRSVPKISVLNGHSATFSMGSTVYYKNSVQSLIPTAATTTNTLTNTYIESDADMKISLKPVISGDDQITLGVKINISDFTSIPTDGSPPPKSTSAYETSLRVNNEDMILLGGIERNETSDSVSGFPILSRIPILKYIFSTKEKTTNKVVTVLFIKPTIMR